MSGAHTVIMKRVCWLSKHYWTWQTCVKTDAKYDKKYCTEVLQKDGHVAASEGPEVKGGNTFLIMNNANIVLFILILKAL